MENYPWHYIQNYQPNEMMIKRLEQAAHGEISSSQKFFRNIAASVMRLLLLDQVSPQEEVTEIVKTCSLSL